MIGMTFSTQDNLRVFGGLFLGASVVATAYGLGVAGLPGEAFVAVLDWCMSNDVIRLASPSLESTIRTALT